MPFTLAGNDFAPLQGLTLKNVGITIKNEKNKTVYSDFGEMLFTHFGVSGPVILSASAVVKDVGSASYTLSIDLKPALDAQTLDARLLREFAQQNLKQIETVLYSLVPHALAPVLLNRIALPPDLCVSQISKQQRAQLVQVLKQLDFSITGTRGFEEAVVTGGGVSLKEVEPATMRSKICENLWFAGEVLDADAFTGGFNLQIAVATGMAAGRHIGQE